MSYLLPLAAGVQSRGLLKETSGVEESSVLPVEFERVSRMLAWRTNLSESLLVKFIWLLINVCRCTAGPRTDTFAFQSK